MPNLTDDQKNNIRAWVAALRSGEFAQGKDLLRKGDNFCCWGVACELHRRTVGTIRWDEGRFGIGISMPPQLVHNWLGAEGGTSQLSDKGLSLADMNDAGYSFSQIADIIEREYLGGPHA